MAFAGQYTTFSIILEKEVTESKYTEAYKVDLPAFPCTCRPLESQPNIELVIPADFEVLFYSLFKCGLMTVYLDNIDGGEGSLAQWAINSTANIYDDDNSAFDIQNVRIFRLNNESKFFIIDRKLNHPNTIYVMDLETVVRKCENNDKVFIFNLKDFDNL